MNGNVPAGSQPSTINTFYHGITYCSSISQGIPEDYCVVLAYSVASYHCQIASPVGTNRLYIRGANGTIWSAWQKLATWGTIELYTSSCAYTYSQHAIKYRKSSGLVNVYIEGLINLPTGSTLLTTIPTECIPTSLNQLDILFPAPESPMTINKLRFTFNSNGQLTVYNYASGTISNNNYQIILTYPLASN